MYYCPDCNTLLGDSTTERLADHRLWHHPTAGQRAAVLADIHRYGTAVENATARGDLLLVRSLLDTLTLLILRAKAYLDAQLTEEVTS